MARAPSNPSADGDEGFLSRWSRRKVEERGASAADGGPDGAAAVDANSSAQEPATAASSAASSNDVVTSKPLPDALPSIDSLTAESDYKIFLRPGVPDGVQRDALRKLWSTVPGLAPIEIAETHMGDFNAVPTFPDGLKDTIYDVVRGFVDRATEPAAESVSTAEEIPSASPPPSAESTVVESPTDPAPGHDLVEDPKPK